MQAPTCHVPNITIWALKQWLIYNGLFKYLYAFHNVTYANFFFTSVQHFRNRGVPIQAADRIVMAIQKLRVKKMFLDATLKNYDVNSILEILQIIQAKIIPTEHTPLIANFSKLLVRLLNKLYLDITEMNNGTIKKRCKYIFYCICIVASRNQTFLDDDLDTLKKWKLQLQKEIYSNKH